MDLPNPRVKLTSDWIGRLVLLIGGVGIGVAASLVIVEEPPETTQERIAVEGDVGGPVEETAEGEGGGTRVITRGGGTTGGQAAQTVGGGDGSSDQAAATNPANFKCQAGENGGSTDAGVSGNAIKVAANYVSDGPGASFLREAIVGVEAVLDEANVEGVCGRKIVLTKRNDSWSASTGLQYIENYINDDHFALVVNPSSEGLDQAVKNGTIDDAGIPVVGTDGMLISQYRWPEKASSPEMAKWLWPVAASTVSTAHIMVQHGAESGAKTFGLVYDKFYKFGVEGKDAFLGAFDRLKGQHGLESAFTIGVDPNNTNNLQDLIRQFNDECGGSDPCDVVAFLLEPSTALQWIDNGGTFGEQITAGPQTLFNRDFAVNCVDVRQPDPCDLIVWTGYNPPVGDLASLPDVAKYVSDVQSRNAQADVENSFTQGAYLGARVFVEALERVGPNLTRENLRTVMDSMSYDTDLTNKLEWTPSNHFANTAMHAFKISATPSGGFAGWSELKDVGWVQDRWVGRY